MAAPAADLSLRVTPAEVMRHMDAREFVSMIDVRSTHAYSQSAQRIRGDFRVNPDDLHILPLLPKEQLTVAYCT